MSFCLRSAILACTLFADGAAAAPVLAHHLAASSEYGMMYWLDGLRSPEWVLQTSQFALRYDHRKLGPVALAPLAKALPEAQAHQGPVPALPPVGFSCMVHAKGASHRAIPASDDPRTSAIVESGRFFQRRWQTATVPGVPCESDRTGLELSAWPDRVTLQFRFCPLEPVESGSLEVSMVLGEGWSLVRDAPLPILRSADGSGFVCQSLDPMGRLTFDAGNGVLRLQSAASDWPARAHPSLGLVLYPAASGLDALARHWADGPASQPIVQATAVEPAGASLRVVHEAAQDWHRILIPEGTPGDDGRMRARITLRNPSGKFRLARLMFDGVPFYIPGLTAVLRDADGFPTGIPVQLSKNWHGKTPPADHPAGFSGEWFHGITMVSLPPESNLELELMMVGENWGGIAAASHAQLSTIGYGGNQQWDQAALGNRGEALCYDMDHVLTDNAFTDSRPFGMINSKGERGWNINVGGGSVLRVAGSGGNPVPNHRMRVRQVRTGPNLAEASFAGLAGGDALDFSYTAALFRANDCTRGFHRIRIRARRDFDFSRLVIYQQAGDSYHYNQGAAISWGNAATPEPVRTWQASGQPGQPVGHAFELAGPSPWIAVTGGPAEDGYHPANHGFIIRSWNARLGGRTVLAPFVRERRTAGNVSILEIVPPPGIHRLQRGDFVELDLVRVYIPQLAEHYAGQNSPFREALKAYPNDPRMVLREAAGNRLLIETNVGSAAKSYPPVIKTRENRAGFRLRGGTGAVPVTFTGLTSYRHPVLEQKTPQGWKAIDQSVVGRDFWQCDFNPSDQTWEITFTLMPDHSFQPVKELISNPEWREFRFRMEKSPDS